MAQKMTGARLFAQTLKAYGVTHVFFMDAILRRALAEMEDVGIKRILGIPKGVAYGGRVRAHRDGPASAWQSVGCQPASGMQDPISAFPVSAIPAHVAPFQHRNSYQEVQHAPLYGAVTKFHAQIDTLEQIPHLMRQAFREATTGTPRPVHLDMAGLTGDAITSLEELRHRRR
jgi:acetolactate synthase-1/2/3 large subunit